MCLFVLCVLYFFHRQTSYMFFTHCYDSVTRLYSAILHTDKNINEMRVLRRRRRRDHYSNTHQVLLGSYTVIVYYASSCSIMLQLLLIPLDFTDIVADHF